MDILDKYQLKEWWVESLTVSQRNQVSNNYRPMGLPVSDTPCLYQNVDKTYFNDGFGKLSLLLTLSHVAESPAKEILKAKAESELTKSNTSANINLIDTHLALASLIQHHYSLRADNKHYEKAKELCLMQISFANKVAKKFRHPEKPTELKRLHKITGIRHPYYDEPQMLPSHTGYKQLAIILEKEGDIKSAIKLSEKALKQGWTDDYDKRLVRLNKKLAKIQ
ncbi:hypothetical protein [Shewanella phaeophyticola]|uniref:Tetratricopeptide repeat protein n=1 Tax=Shewanella phaeophyticola TaxID=2978345 RepID=A0ABT2NXU1_9GAMM|nr:hypothetical protein [Shewanella sp. KJ10-1]MCT8985227.1 hypothetical protein [Shewanella sp. KJ10-1]